MRMLQHREFYYVLLLLKTEIKMLMRHLKSFEDLDLTLF